jgi:plastocyanin
MRTRASLIAVLFLVAGCGGAASTPGAQPAASEQPAGITPAAASQVVGAGCPEEPEPTGTPCFEIAIRDFAFDPPSLAVPPVARVVFTNEDGASHSIQWSDGEPTSPGLGTGERAERTFMSAPAGAIGYVCGIHGSSMSGEIMIDDTLPIP